MMDENSIGRCMLILMLAQEQLNARFHPEQFVPNDLGDFEDFLLDEDESEW